MENATQTTRIILNVRHKNDISDLLAKVAGMSRTIDGVISVDGRTVAPLPIKEMPEEARG